MSRHWGKYTHLKVLDKQAPPKPSFRTLGSGYGTSIIDELVVSIFALFFYSQCICKVTFTDNKHESSSLCSYFCSERHSLRKYFLYGSSCLHLSWQLDFQVWSEQLFRYLDIFLYFLMQNWSWCRLTSLIKLRQSLLLLLLHVH